MGLLALELVGLILMWHSIGAWTLLWLFAAALAGFALLRRERRGFMARLLQAVESGRLPFDVLLHGFRRVTAAVLLILPGPLSDALALALLAWPSGRPPPARRSASTSQAEDVIEGEFRRLD
ncbi:MAG: FxsA family protein [Thiobacillaceae bacterium]|nr:FxsA family protein [Thiobacillaceae bacterium]MCX7672687.1 FxsA family protein [Thiobacillaceae bacterium]MDW8323704.1 FxsA family protein [Burkholderiales bacterium]